MAFEKLADFISQLEDDRDIVRIRAEVDPLFELAEITERVCKTEGGGPAIFFENVRGSAIPVVTNLLGSQRRICKALGTADLDDIGAKIAGLIQPELPEGWLESMRLVPRLAQLTRLAPSSVKTAACQQIVKLGRDVDLSDLPAPHCWPGEAARTITVGQVHTRHPHTGVRDVGLYPVQLRGQNTVFVHWNRHQDGCQNFDEYRQLGRPMPVAVVLGGDPVLTYAASAPLPSQTDECIFAGFLRDKPIDVVKCRSIEMDVPADAEIVLEGSIEAEAPLETAPGIACQSGYYGVAEELPTVNVTAVTHRSNPMFPAMIPGKPPTEGYWLAKATERIFLPFVRLFAPEIVDMHLPAAGVFQNLLFVSIRKRYPHQARKVMHSLWGLKRLMTMKIVVVVDEHVDVHDEQRVWFHVGANAHPGRDVLFTEGPTHFSDHAAPVAGMGHRMGIDATRKLPEEGYARDWPDELDANEKIRTLVDSRWAEYGLGRAPTDPLQS